MKKNSLIVWFVILIFTVGCNKTKRILDYCGFDYCKLLPDSACIPNLRVIARYSDNALVSLRFYSGQNLIKQDTVIMSSGIDFLMSRNRIGLDTLIRIAAVLKDTSRTFVFYKVNSSYDLAMIETVLSDTSVKVAFVERGTLHFDEISSDVFAAIYSKYSKIKAIEDYLVIDYCYSNGVLNYEVLESHSYMKGLGRLATEKIVLNNNCMYLDMPLVEDRSVLFLYKQLNSLMNPY